MSNLDKDSLLCGHCNQILDKPVYLPCFCTICHIHLYEATANHMGIIKCEPCGVKFEVANVRVKENLHAKQLLAANNHLYSSEMAKYEDLYATFSQQMEETKELCKEKFASIRLQIELRRDTLTHEINQLASELIAKTNGAEKIYENALKKFQQKITGNLDFESLSMPDLIPERMQHLDDCIHAMKANINEIYETKSQIDSIEFRVNETSPELGVLCYEPEKQVAKKCISRGNDNKIKIWDLKTGKVFHNLDAHKIYVTCLEVIDQNTFASASNDTNIKVWDATNGTCLRTLVGHSRGVLSLKRVATNKIASGSLGQIKIWNLETGACLKTINTSYYLIRCMCYMSKGILFCGAYDKKVTMWDLTTSRCLQTFSGHTRDVKCLMLLEKGLLASGSSDCSIRIWHIESGQCTRTLLGHFSGIMGLEVSLYGEIVSCSHDGTIKVWDSSMGTCIETLREHTKAVRSIVIYADNLLISASNDDTIKMWDLETLECIDTLDTGTKEVRELKFF